MKTLKTLMILLVTSLIFSYCKKSTSGGGNSYPRQVSITYRWTSSAIDSLVLITYDNETGGKITVNNPRLPFSKSITKTVHKYDIVTAGYFVNPAKAVKIEILVNDKVVKSKENNSPNEALSYTFD